MNFNVADLPAVRAQLEHDVAQQSEPESLPPTPAGEVKNPRSPSYPAKSLALKNGHYCVVDHDK